MGEPGRFMRAGKRARMRSAMSEATFLGIEIGGTKLQIVRGDAAGRIARRWRATVDRERGGPGIQEQLAAGLEELTPAGSSKSRAITVGFGGPVESVTGRVRVSHQIPGWEDFPLRDW